MAGFSDVVTRVTTTQELPLGYTVEIPAVNPGTAANTGIKVWIYVQATEALVAGELCMRSAGAAVYTVRKTPAAAQAAQTVVGVAQHAIALNSYGFIQRKGLAEVLADTGGLSADSAIKDGNVDSGRADNVAAATDASFGVCTETVLAGVLATCFIDCRG